MPQFLAEPVQGMDCIQQVLTSIIDLIHLQIQWSNLMYRIDFGVLKGPLLK